MNQRKQLEKKFQQIEYSLIYWTEFDFTLLKNVPILTRHRQHNKPTVNDVILFADTETSKSRDSIDNYIVIWTLTVRLFNRNLVTLYGRKPSEFADCLNVMQTHFQGLQTFIYIHNLSYDWTFLRKFLIEKFGPPSYQLNTKSHYPIHIEFMNGIILKDSLILAQRTLEKWAKDLNAEHQKAVGSWDYDAIRDQSTPLTREELTYAEYDTLAGAECIDILKGILHHKIYAMPWTATGIPRGDLRKIGNKNNAHAKFLRQALTFPQLIQAQKTYHGGYTHGNRAYYGYTVDGIVTAYDFASSYPYVMLSEKYPAEKFTSMPDCSISDILEDVENAYLFKLIAIDVKLIDYMYPMPALQYSKCVKVVNPVIDNGRLLEADYIEIYLTEIDLEVIMKQYHFARHICVEVYAAFKDYLPRWFTDYVYQLFVDKTKLKGGDPVNYAIAKAKLNSCYGLTVQFPVKDTIQEDYENGEYHIEPVDKEEKYKEFLLQQSSILNYQIGVWVTAYAFKNLFDLGACAGVWLYSDTDSAYGMDWNTDAIRSYNEGCKKKLRKNKYEAVHHNGRDYWLGVAELDGVYSQFRLIGAKRYCVRDAETQELKITVAGVPKKAGAKCLDDDIENFKDGFIFSGEKTGKKLHTYNLIDDIYIDRYGNEIGDSIDLSPCDYQLSSVRQWGDIINIYEYGEEFFTDE